MYFHYRRCPLRWKMSKRNPLGTEILSAVSRCIKVALKEWHPPSGWPLRMHNFNTFVWFCFTLPLSTGYKKDDQKYHRGYLLRDQIHYGHKEFRDNLIKPEYAGTFSEYSQIMIQFGYVTLFVLVFPLAPMLAFLNNIIQIKIDGKSLLVSLGMQILVCLSWSLFICTVDMLQIFKQHRNLSASFEDLILSEQIISDLGREFLK